MPIAAAASHDHAGTACVLLGLSSASENGDKPSVPHGHSTSRSNGEVPRTSQQQQQPQWQGVGSHPGHPGSVHHERTVAAAIAASGEDDDLAYTGKRRTQVAALPRKEWSLAEDDLIRHGVQMLGCKWRVIAAQLPGRSDDAVRNRWSRLQESMRPPEQQQPNPKSAASLAAPSIGGGGGGSSSASDGTARQPGPPDKEADRKSAPEKKERASWDKKERTSWTRAEDDIIVQCVAELGHKWFEIARRLPARQAAACEKARPKLRPLRQPPPRPPTRPLLGPPHRARPPVSLHCAARSAPPRPHTTAQDGPCHPQPMVAAAVDPRPERRRRQALSAGGRGQRIQKGRVPARHACKGARDEPQRVGPRWEIGDRREIGAWREAGLQRQPRETRRGRPCG